MGFCVMLILYAIILLVPLFYWYSTRKLNYWSSRGVKGPTPNPFFGNLIELFLKEKRNEEINLLKKYGRIYGVYNANLPVLTVAEPELIKNILVKDFHLFTDRQTPFFMNAHPILSKHLGFVSGQDWRRIRSIVSPTFSSGKMRKMYPMIKECLHEFIGVLGQYARDGKPADLKDLSGKYTMDAMATCAFATKTEAQTNPKSAIVENVKKIFNPSPYRLIPLLIFPSFLIKLLNIKYTVDESVNEYFFGLTRHIMNERKNGSEKHNDFIQLLLNSQKNGNNKEEVVVRDVNDVNESHHVNEGDEELAVEENVLGRVYNRFITEDEILAQSWTFLNAGFEATSTILASASYELALNQDIQQRLYEEVLSAVDANGDIDYDLLSKLQYLDSVISETLRLHSSAMRLTRIASEDYKLGETGITIEKGQSVEIPIYAIHHSEEFFDNPQVFDPDRFMPQNRHKIIKYSYLPFGGGPRHCVGMRFALMEIKLGLAQEVKNFKLTKCSQTDVPLVYSFIPGINPIKRTILGVENRI